MTTQNGMITTYNNTVPQKTMITDRIIMADPYDITTMLALGLDNASKFQFVNTPGRTYEWLEDAFPVVSGLINEADLSTTTNTTIISVTSAAVGDLLHVGDIIQVDSEYMYVSAESAGEVTVVRAFGAATTTSVSHDTSSTFYIRYNARLEGADSSTSPWTEVSSNTNCSTIFHKEVYVTRDDRLFPNFGLGNDLLNYRIDMNMKILMEQLNRLPYYGQRAAGTTSTARSSGGFGTFITTNATGLSSVALTRKAIDDEFQQIFAAGGVTNLILCDAWGQRKINDFYEGFVETTRAESIGGIMIKQLMHPITGVLVDVVVDRHCPAGNMYLLDKRYVGYLTIDPFFYEELAKSGDYTKGQTIGEYGFVCAYNKAHSILSSYSTIA